MVHPTAQLPTWVVGVGLVIVRFLYSNASEAVEVDHQHFSDPAESVQFNTANRNNVKSNVENIHNTNNNENPTSKISNRPPNIIYILTDDQDVTANSLDYMPHLNKLFREQGMEFTNFFVPTGLCCPSRATILTGQYCHNTKLYDNGDLNNETYKSGGIEKFLEADLEEKAAPRLLQQAGYETALVGKYLNKYYDGMAQHVPVGWDHWMGMTKTAYYGPHFSNHGTLLETSSDTYQTDYIRDWVYQYITHKRDQEKPFFMYVAPFAPHAPATPAERHKDLFSELRAPRYASYNPTDDIQRSKPSWIKTMPPLTEAQINGIDVFYRNRLRSLQAVDEMLLNLTDTLDELDLTHDTYVFYMGDNGQHLGDYRLPAGKRQAYDTDVNVPFLVRGPGVEGGVKATEVLQSVDLLPTWLDLATSTSTFKFNSKSKSTYVNEDGQIQDALHSMPSRVLASTTSTTKSQPPFSSSSHDGKSIIPLLHSQISPSPSTNQFRSVALLELYSGSSTMGPNYDGLPSFYKGQFWNNTYQALRIVNASAWWLMPHYRSKRNTTTAAAAAAAAAAALEKQHVQKQHSDKEGNETMQQQPYTSNQNNWLFVQWCTGEKELYDSDVDPHQINNLVNDVEEDMVARLVVLASRMGSCKGAECYNVDLNIDLLDRGMGLKNGAESAFLPCHNPIHMDGGVSSLSSSSEPSANTFRRQPWAVGLEVPPPLTDGFVFADSDVVEKEVLEAWEDTYMSYFY